MRFLIPLAVAAAVAAPAFAQDAAPAQAPSQAPSQSAAAASAQSPEEAALEAKAEAFEARMDQMTSEIDAIMDDQSKDAATASAEANAVVDRYAPGMAEFADEVEAFVKAEAEKPEHAAQKDQMLMAATQAGQSIRAIPDQVRAGIQQAIAARAAAPTAPATPQ